jgi:xanthine dehydrogenase iron-sulfur cluster and FAD-binding subunit A
MKWDNRGAGPLYAASGGPHQTRTGEKAAGFQMSEIAFLLNGTPMRLAGEPPTRTLLDWLRDTRHLTGTKEGCNEGDCGACTVMVTDVSGTCALNACILFLPQLHGKAVRTVEGIAAPDGRLHPVQQAMIGHHGSQCGFCTPGFVVSMAVAHLQGRQDHDDVLAGNLCRCTGYAPIIRAAEAAENAARSEAEKEAAKAAVLQAKLDAAAEIVLGVGREELFREHAARDAAVDITRRAQAREGGDRIVDRVQGRAVHVA